MKKHTTVNITTDAIKLSQTLRKKHHVNISLEHEKMIKQLAKKYKVYAKF